MASPSKFWRARPLRNSRSLARGASNLRADSKEETAVRSQVSESRSTNMMQTPAPISPMLNDTPTTEEKPKEGEDGHPTDQEHKGEMPSEDEVIEELENRVEELERQLTREENEADVPLVSRPEVPTREQVEQHNATHATYKAWCKHCVRGLATRDKHVTKKMKGKKYKRTKIGQVDVPDTEEPRNGVTKYSIDYMRMDSQDDKKSTSTMVMVNHEDGGIYAYATPGKGIQGDRYWLPKRIAKDIDNSGSKDVQVQIKSDQEPAIVTVQEEIREIRRGKTICVNSPVGESECNGRAENAIRRVEIKVRTLRSYIGEQTKSKLDMNKPFATWLIRWAGEILTKYTRGKDGKTA